MADTTNCQEPGPVGNKSTQTMLRALNDAAKAEEPVNDFVSRLRRLNLEPDEGMLRLLSDHPNYGNRLISLFKMFKQTNVSMTDKLSDIISKNISSVGGAVNLLGLIKELEIDPQTISLACLFDAARFDLNIAQSARELHHQGQLDSATFKLLLTHPEQSLEISRLLINLQEHAYNVESLVERLGASSISSKHMSTILDLLNLMLENESYYSNAVDIFLRQEQYITKIYEGAKKLVAEHYPLCGYFELVENNPQNANVFAKNILLFHNASLIEPDYDLLGISKLGVGAYHFMKHLQQADMLRAANLQTMGQPNNILNQKEVIEHLSSLPLITNFEREELAMMLELANKEEVSPKEIQIFNALLEDHLISSSICAPSLCY
ncbi:hypothetical protein [Legionella sp. PC997]|uniref:hypothetical protein n=1 Tax=Legionella sp. PC997 TaxID=2755562 RepID=UPI0015FE0C8D|nr:hypothetical protein [Legionella sp. PC997]QMT59333.1 hypothetical protein HBNCFIEN_00698 [Legionella sp. PC997]